MWLTFMFIGTAGLFLMWTLCGLRHVRWIQRLPSLEALRPPDAAGNPEAEPIRCSVVIAARNEEARIKQTLARLLRQQGIAGEFIIVDDRSADGTNAILHKLAQQDSRVKVMRVDALPAGWLGKCHACHLGANVATGDWILFTDADCWLAADLIARAVRLARREGVEHVSLTSGVSSESLSLQAGHLAFLLSLANWFSGVNRDRPKAYFGIGAFNLVRTDAYRQCGGYEALRLTVLDDVRLGLLLRRAGKRTRAFIGGDDVECHWGTSAWSTVKIMEKNYFAALDYRTGLVLAGSAFVILVCAILVLGLLSGTAAGLAAVCSPLSLILPAGILARRLGWPWRSALLVPFMLLLFLYALLNSAMVTLLQGGVRWRDTFYSLDSLRAGNVTPKAAHSTYKPLLNEPAPQRTPNEVHWL